MRYIVTSLKEGEVGKELINLEETDKTGIDGGYKVLSANGYKPTELKERIVEEPGGIPVKVKIRKPRSDAGQPHKGKAQKEKPVKTPRNRGQFFVIDSCIGTIAVCNTRPELDTTLDSVKDAKTLRIIQGRELKIKFTLEPIK